MCEYGDIAPHTPLGQALASAVMIIEYAIIAVPTGIYTTELARQYRHDITNTACQTCVKEGHASDADFYKYCGNPLEENE
jgi:voltage-gated potassium channel